MSQEASLVKYKEGLKKVKEMYLHMQSEKVSNNNDVTPAMAPGTPSPLVGKYLVLL